MDVVASDDSSYINGTDFLVDGGLHACYVVSVSLLPDPGPALTPLRRRPRVTRCFPLRRVLSRTSASSPRVLERRVGVYMHDERYSSWEHHVCILGRLLAA
jgi:hypothetical protein